MVLQGDQLSYKDGASLVEAPAGSGLPARRVTVVNDTPIPVDIGGGSITIDGDVNVLGDAKTSGTVDGTETGTERTFVNNRKNQVLASHDLQAAYTWLDFGNKNERVSQIQYTSATFPGVTVTRSFAYTLVGTQYRLDSETWVTNPGG